MVQRAATWFGLVALATAFGCGGPKAYMNPNADLAAVKTLAVLPLDVVIPDKIAGERVQRILLTELLVYGGFEVVEPGHVVHAMRRLGRESSALTSDDFKQLGRDLKADALLLGTLLEYDDGSAASGARVTLQLRLVEAGTGATIWSISRGRNGATATSRLFGVGARRATALAEELIREELDALQ